MLDRLLSALPPRVACRIEAVNVTLLDEPAGFRFSSSPAEIRAGHQGVVALLGPDESEQFGPPEARVGALAFALAHELGHLVGTGDAGNHAQRERAVDLFALRLVKDAGYYAVPAILAEMAAANVEAFRRLDGGPETIELAVAIVDQQLRLFELSSPRPEVDEFCEFLHMLSFLDVPQLTPERLADELVSSAREAVDRRRGLAATPEQLEAEQFAPPAGKAAYRPPLEQEQAEARARARAAFELARAIRNAYAGVACPPSEETPAFDFDEPDVESPEAE